LITLEQLHPNDRGYINGYIGYCYHKFCIARRYNPKTIIEIGVRAGYSAYAFLCAVPEASYYGLDAENGTHGGEGGPYMSWTRELLSRFKKVTLQVIDTQKVTSLDICKADLIHVDGDHSQRGVEHDLELVLPYLADGGVILVDDFDRALEVKEGTRHFLSLHPELKSKYIETFNGDVLIGSIKGVFDD